MTIKTYNKGYGRVEAEIGETNVSGRDNNNTSNSSVVFFDWVETTKLKLNFK